MSCFINSDKETSTIAKVYVKKYPQSNVLNVASVLSFINIQSVNCRYRLNNKRSKFKGVDFNAIDLDGISEAQQAKLIDCYIYQCDSNRNRTKFAEYNNLILLRENLNFSNADYDAAQWGLYD